MRGRRLFLIFPSKGAIIRGRRLIEGRYTVSLRAADVFRRERSDDRKYVCCSQATIE